jgi:hypothetical protein
MSKRGELRRAWRFFRAGGVDQALIADADDLLALGELDQRLWIALACPVKGLEFDERTLALLDTDNDGRVRAPELVAAVTWLKQVLADPRGLVDGKDGVPLAAIATSTTEGQAVLASARQLLALLGKSDSAVVTVDDTVQAKSLSANAARNGDGVVPPAAINDDEARAAAEDCLRTVGGGDDRSGQRGITTEALQTFFAKLAEHAAWQATAEANASTVLPLGAATAAAADAVDAIAAKVDDWFVRARLAAFDARAQTAVNVDDKVFADVATGDLEATAPALRRLPLAHVAADRPFDLAGPMNPAWQAEVATLRTAAVEPLLGTGVTTLSEAQWRAMRERLAPYRAWRAASAGAEVAPLGLERIRALLASGVRARLEQAIAEDLAAAAQIDGAEQVERLARCWRDLFRLANNFVSFSDFYGRRTAVFQAGTLHLDARTTELCVQVLDANKHAALAMKSGAYLVYVECTRPGDEKMTVACALTSGDCDMVFVGRNGIFYDRKGRDWDATVTRVVENPIGIGQAFWSPYKKLVRWLEETSAKRAAAADDDAYAQLQTSTAATASGAPTPAPEKPKLDIGVVAALGVAVGGITAALGALLQALFGLGLLMPIGVLGAMALISGPSMFLAWLKLRQRNIGPILDANGWAVNALTTVNIPLGRSLTTLASLPPGSSHSLADPFAPKKSAWRPLAAVLVVALGAFGAWKAGLLPLPTTPAAPVPAAAPTTTTTP